MIAVIWLNRHGLVRVVWRLTIFSLLLLAIGFTALVGTASALALLTGTAASLSLGRGPLHIQVLAYTVSILAVFVASGLSIRFLDRRSLGSLGLGLHSGWLRQFFLGLLAGALCITGIVAALVAAGGVQIGGSSIPADTLLVSFFMTLLVSAGAGFLEELLFRGYALQVLAEGLGDYLNSLRQKGLWPSVTRRSLERIGMVVASVLLAVPFGLAHLNNAGATAIGALVASLGGLVLSIAYFRTRSLWLPVGMHISWNFFLGWVFSLPVSGESLQNVPFTTVVRGPEWLSGGSFGPEGSVAAVLVLVGIGFYFLWSRRLVATADALAEYPSPGERQRSHSVTGLHG